MVLARASFGPGFPASSGCENQRKTILEGPARTRPGLQTPLLPSPGGRGAGARLPAAGLDRPARLPHFGAGRERVHQRRAAGGPERRRLANALAGGGRRLVLPLPAAGVSVHLLPFHGGTAADLRQPAARGDHPQGKAETGLQGPRDPSCRALQRQASLARAPRPHGAVRRRPREPPAPPPPPALSGAGREPSAPGPPGALPQYDRFPVPDRDHGRAPKVPPANARAGGPAPTWRAGVAPNDNHLAPLRDAQELPWSYNPGEGRSGGYVDARREHARVEPEAAAGGPEGREAGGCTRGPDATDRAPLRPPSRREAARHRGHHLPSPAEPLGGQDPDRAIP